MYERIAELEAEVERLRDQVMDLTIAGGDVLHQCQAVEASNTQLTAELDTVRGELNEIGGKWVEEERRNTHLTASLSAMREALEKIGREGEKGMDMWGCRFAARQALALPAPTPTKEGACFER